MNYQLGIAAIAATFFAVPAFSAGVTGGDIGLSYSAFTEDTDFAKTSLAGSLEFGMNRQFAVQGDLGYHGFHFIDESATTIGLHGIYHLSDESSLGLFVGQERFMGESQDFYGVEFGHEFQNFDVELYVGEGESAGDTGTAYGFSGRYAANDVFGLGIAYDRIDLGVASANRIGLKGDLALGSNTVVTAEYGTVDGSIGGLSASEGYFGVGVRMAFGAERGATFDRRGIARLIPGL